MTINHVSHALLSEYAIFITKHISILHLVENIISDLAKNISNEVTNITFHLRTQDLFS